MSSFHENLRSIMNDKKLTAENIAEKMGVSTSTVTHWSNGRRFPKNEDFIKSLASILGVHTSDLLDTIGGIHYEFMEFNEKRFCRSKTRENREKTT